MISSVEIAWEGKKKGRSWVRVALKTEWSGVAGKRERAACADTGGETRVYGERAACAGTAREAGVYGERAACAGTAREAGVLRYAWCAQWTVMPTVQLQETWISR